jgi:hypothetical protein
MTEDELENEYRAFGNTLIEIIRENWCPERSKREDSLVRDIMKSSAMDISKIDNDPPYPLVWDKELNFIGHKVIEEMRCSEHNGNVVREVQ